MQLLWNNLNKPSALFFQNTPPPCRVVGSEVCKRWTGIDFSFRDTICDFSLPFTCGGLFQVNTQALLFLLRCLPVPPLYSSPLEGATSTRDSWVASRELGVIWIWQGRSCPESLPQAFVLPLDPGPLTLCSSPTPSGLGGSARSSWLQLRPGREGGDAGVLLSYFLYLLPGFVNPPRTEGPISPFLLLSDRCSSHTQTFQVVSFCPFEIH